MSLINFFPNKRANKITPMPINIPKIPDVITCDLKSNANINPTNTNNPKIEP